jgi:hypothetical protein
LGYPPIGLLDEGSLGWSEEKSKPYIPGLNAGALRLRGGKFSGEVELFYLEFAQQFIENKHFRIGLELALLVAVGGANRGSL